MKKPIFVALDVDTEKEAMRIIDLTAPHVGGFKIGPRLVIRYGAEFLKRAASRGALFIDNKYFDIPSTMEGAVRAAFEVGASYVTVHAQSGRAALTRLAEMEKELSAERPFQILAVTVLTSFEETTLPAVLKAMPIPQMVEDLAALAVECGLSGLVCSPEEVWLLRSRFQKAFLLVPGIRMEGASANDQMRIAGPTAAMHAGASALVVGRPILQASDPARVAKEYSDAAASGSK